MFSDANTQQTARQSAQQAIGAGVTDRELASLARSPEVKVRAAVAAHSGTPLTTLLKLAEDRSADVRIGLARNRRRGIPIELHEDLSKDRNVDVVYALIDNPAVPEAIIAKLGRHLHREYAKAARGRLADAKRGVFPGVEEAEPEPMPEVPAFPPPAAKVERTPVVPAHSAKSDALDALLGQSKR